jgi:hypothetical protein
MVNEFEAYGMVQNHDIQIWEKIESIIRENDLDLRYVLESFPIYVRRVNLSRFLMHYELFKLAVDVCGSFVECGVYRGSSLLTWAKLFEIFRPGDRSRKVIGFDNFQGFTSIHEKDGPLVKESSKELGGWNPSAHYEELLKHIDLFQEDCFIPRARNRIELVVGDICVTAPKWVQENNGVRICLLHLDCDLYEPTMAALNAFYPLVVNGGVVILDEYGMSQWGGEASAFDEYIEKNGFSRPKMKTMSLYNNPSAYFIKGE